MYLLWQIHSEPHSRLPHVDPGTPISVSDFEVHCRLEEGGGLLALTVIWRCWPDGGTASSAPTLQPLVHCISSSSVPCDLTVTTCLPSLMSLPAPRSRALWSTPGTGTPYCRGMFHSSVHALPRLQETTIQRTTLLRVRCYTVSQGGHEIQSSPLY